MDALTPTLRAAVVVAAVAAVGNALLAVAHLGVTVPVLSRFGPQGGAVPPAVVAFTVGTAVFTAVAVGLARQRRWAFVAGLVVSGLAISSGISNYRGAASGGGIVLAVLLAGLLLAPPSRRQLTRNGERRRARRSSTA